MNKVKIQEVLGKHYSKPIIKHLVGLGFSSPSGGTFTPQIIQNIVDGRTANIDIMEAITAFVVATEKKLERLKNALK
ncbi:hypothetical protein [Flavobacterium sp.]|uniref:hypothetical protein n=1 Tax=Flavobacterium sp. TaxID=239 RepID=UPI00374CD1ED